MSKLSETLKLVQTGVVVPVTHNTKVISSWDDVGLPSFDVCREYTLAATFESRLLMTESMRHEGAALEVVNTARRAVIHGVFGEFRDPLYRLAEQLNQHDIGGARNTLEGILEQMFT